MQSSGRETVTNKLTTQLKMMTGTVDSLGKRLVMVVCTIGLASCSNGFASQTTPNETVLPPTPAQPQPITAVLSRLYATPDFNGTSEVKLIVENDTLCIYQLLHDGSIQSVVPMAPHPYTRVDDTTIRYDDGRALVIRDGDQIRFGTNTEGVFDPGNHEIVRAAVDKAESACTATTGPVVVAQLEAAEKSSAQCYRSFGRACVTDVIAFRHQSPARLTQRWRRGCLTGCQTPAN